jgi:hypothetical protein
MYVELRKTNPEGIPFFFISLQPLRNYHVTAIYSSNTDIRRFVVTRIKTCKRILLATAAIVIASLGAELQAEESARDRAANAAAQSVHDEATRILESIKRTEYKHRTEIDEEKGVYLCDCSGLVGYVLNRTVGKEDGSGALGDGRKRPLAMDYEKFFAAASAESNEKSRWQRVERLADARPGDIIAWRHEKPRPGNTGHVVIVDQAPVVEKDGLVRVVVIDSTTRPQVDDTRPDGTSGVGRGSMWFVVDKEGRAVAHLRGARDAEPRKEAISIGRALPFKPKPASREAA